MKNIDLQRALAKFPDDLEIVEDRFSDNCLRDNMNLPMLIELLPRRSDPGWLMHVHSSMTSEQKAKAKTYLLI